MTTNGIELDGDPQQLRAYVARMAAVLQQHEDSSYVRGLAETVAKEVDKGNRFGLLGYARAIPQGSRFATGFSSNRVQRPGLGNPIVPRDETTNAAVAALLEATEEAIVQIENHQALAQQNASLPLPDKRALALAAAVELDKENGGAYIWINNIRWTAHLTMRDLSDVLEYWEHQGAVEAHAEDQRPVSRLRVTFIGRERAAAEPSSEPLVSSGFGPIYIHQHAPGSVQQFGPGSFAHIQSVTITNLDDGLRQIRDFLPQYSFEEREEVEEQLAVIEEEQRGAGRPARIKGALRAIQQLTIEAQKTFAPTIEAVTTGVIKGLKPG